MNRLLHDHHCFFARPEIWVRHVKDPDKSWPVVDYSCSPIAPRQVHSDISYMT